MNPTVSLIVILAISFFYCEFLWWWLKNGATSPLHIQKSAKMVIIFNYFLAVALQSWGSLIFATIISLYYFVIIPQRLLEKSKQD